MAVAVTNSKTIFDQAATVGRTIVGVTVFVASAVVVVAVAPFVSAVALPIFAIKALPKWIEHKELYAQTLYNGTRVKYGRVEGQDYTNWYGQAKANVIPTDKDRLHELLNSYVHGKVEWVPNSTTFNTVDDILWLDKEVKRREVEDYLNEDLKMIRAFAKALIPIAGILWVFATETGAGGASSVGCTVCMLGGDEDKHWSWQEAISHHRRISSAPSQEV